MRKILLIPITIICHLIAEIHAEYRRVFDNKMDAAWHSKLAWSASACRKAETEAKALAEKVAPHLEALAHETAAKASASVNKIDQAFAAAPKV